VPQARRGDFFAKAKDGEFLWSLRKNARVGASTEGSDERPSGGMHSSAPAARLTTRAAEELGELHTSIVADDEPRIVCNHLAVDVHAAVNVNAMAHRLIPSLYRSAVKDLE
jgi:hypothetical protein